MAKKEGLIYKFFEKWKDRKLNKLAKSMLRGNPELEKALKDLGDEFEKVAKEINKSKK
tara:strand:+ start:245 stop:418 length:174 start_codon:yes stop_codon:yes gene_type:complete